MVDSPGAPPGTEVHEPTGSLRTAGWRSRLAIFSAAALLFLTVSGLLIWSGPFSCATQVSVIGHTVLGILFMPPLALYCFRHWRRHANHPLTHIKLLGYLAVAILLSLAVSGVILTGQATLGRTIDRDWRALHRWATLLLVAFTVPHVLLLYLRGSRGSGSDPPRGELSVAARTYMRWMLLLATAACVPLLVGVAGYRPLSLLEEFPPGYQFWEPRTDLYQANRPFAPSLARTADGKPIDARLLAGSRGCGTEGCHEEIVREWLPSAHRYAAMDRPFQAIQYTMGQQNGPMSTRYCGGCHDPISLFSGDKNIYTADTELTGKRGYHEGVSCLGCHAIRETDLKGNANYVITAPPRYLGELEFDETGSFAWRALRDFLIRAYPDQHRTSLTKTMFKKPEYCAACHKQFVDEEINKVGWVQLQNQFDNWKNSRWARTRHDPRRTLECRECHMPLVDSTDPASGDGSDYNRSPGDGKHRSHRFIAANQFLPELMQLEGAAEQVALTEKWLQGKYPIPEIQDKWAPEGVPAVSVEVQAPVEVAAGESVEVRCIVTSNKVGHDFPSGPLDIIQSWLEVRVTGPDGTLLHESGAVDSRGFVDPDAFMFKAEPVDQSGNLIDRHNLWEMVGVRQRRALFPGFSDTASYEFLCPDLSPGPRVSLPVEKSIAFPAKAPGKIQVRVKLRYRKVDQFLLNYLSTAGLFEKGGSLLTAPITDMHETGATIRVLPREVRR